MAAEHLFIIPITDKNSDIDVRDVDDELEQEELSLSHDEIRNRYQYGVALTQGVVLPWQMRGGALYKLEGEYASHLLSTGGGHFSFYDSTTSRRDKTAFDSISLFYSYRVFFTEMMPIFFEGSVGYATWNGTFEAMDLGLENAGGSEVASAFEASGAVTGINLGFMWPWENGIFVEYSLFRIGKSFILEDRYDAFDSIVRKRVQNQIESPLSWGYLNLRLGWLF